MGKVKDVVTRILQVLKDSEGKNEFRPHEQLVQIPECDNFSLKKLGSFLGPAVFVSIGYMDPGNWATDISGGSQFGYRLIWVLLVSNLMALTLQTLSFRLGIITRRDLAQLCRLQYPKPVRITLWAIVEIAIVATDLAEVLGTAIGLQILFRLPLLAGVLLTSLDTLLFLLIQKYGIRKLEAFVVFLLAVVAMCFVVELFLVKADAVDVVRGFIPSIDSDSIVVASGILGATVMPHNFYLHSSMVQSRSFASTQKGIRQAFKYNFVDTCIALNFAFFINMSILIVAAAVFYTKGQTVNELQDAHELLGALLHSKAAPVMFGLGLVCAGQASTLTGTLAGQIVMEGFLEFKMVPWLRRLVTRLAAILPAAIVVAVAGDKGSYSLLILSQVILSISLPFCIIPLIRFSSSKHVAAEYSISKWLTVLSWLIAVAIIALNVWVVGGYIVQLMKMSTAALVLTVIFILPVAAAFIALGIYLTFFWKSVDVQLYLQPLNDEQPPPIEMEVDFGESSEHPKIPVEDIEQRRSEGSGPRNLRHSADINTVDDS